MIGKLHLDPISIVYSSTCSVLINVPDSSATDLQGHAANKCSRRRGRGYSFTCKWYVGNCTPEKHLQTFASEYCIFPVQFHFIIVVILSHIVLLLIKLSCTRNCFSFLCVSLRNNSNKGEIFVCLTSQERNILNTFWCVVFYFISIGLFTICVWQTYIGNTWTETCALIMMVAAFNVFHGT